jgi:uncharacterized protein (DUF58 family)
MVYLTQLGRMVGLFALAFFLIGFVNAVPFMYIIALFCLLVLCIGSFFAWLSLRRLQCTRHLPSAMAYSGDPLESHILLREGRGSWRILEVFDQQENVITGQQKRRRMTVLFERGRTRAVVSGAREPVAMTLDGERHIEVRDTLLFSRRGFYKLGPLTVHAYDPIGLVYLPHVLPGEHEVIVYPRPLPIPEQILGGAGGRQTTEVRPIGHAGESADFHSIRPYVQGDDLRRVHWKATAHTGRLAVKEFEYRHSGSVQVILDLQSGIYHGTGDFATLESAITLTASLLNHVLQMGNQAGFVSTGSTVSILAPESGQKQLHRMLEILALAKDDGTVPLTKALSSGEIPLSRRCTTIVVTASTDKAMIGPLLALRGRAAQVLLVLLDARSFHDAEQAANRPKNPLLALATTPITLTRNGNGHGLPTVDAHRDLMHAAAAAGIEVFPLTADLPLHQALQGIRMRM